MDSAMSERQTALSLCELIHTYQPAIFLFSATAVGRSIAAQTAAMLGTGLTAGCTGLTLREDGLLLQTRPSYEGSLLAEIICPEKKPQMATVMPGLFPASSPDYSRTGEFLPFSAIGNSGKIKLLKRTLLQQAQALSQADIVVAGGAGIGSPEQFGILKQFADRIGAAVGASRGAVNAGYASPECQIGQTGSSIRPRLYLAFAISGAVQHLSGIRGAEYIIAVNRDPEAPIFSAADLALVCDWREGLEAIATQYEALLQNRNSN